MKYELIGKNNLFNPIETILQNRGIGDIQSFLNVNEDCVIHWSKLININKAVDCLLKHIENKSKIYIPIDPDADGFCSCAILINYLNKIFPGINIAWEVPNGKEHGVKVENVKDDINLVIIPDAGSNQFKEHKQLKERGIDVIVLDHHECSEESKDAIVVNSQISPDYTNKSLTGGGIVYKFCKALDDKLNINNADYYLDLVSLANIGDMADSRELETRYYMNEGLKYINNSFFQALIDKQSFSLKGNINIVGIQFYIVPLINGAIRAGSKEDKENMMEAFLDSDKQMYYKRNDEYQSIQTFMARTIYNLKNKQNKQRDKGVNLINEKIQLGRLDDNKILVVEISDLLDKNLTGLVANQLVQLYKRPVLLLRNKDDETLSGSMRGYEKGVIKDLKQFLSDTEQFVFVEGHSNAAGIEIKKGQVGKVIQLTNEQLKDIEIDVDIHNVDLIIPANQLKIGLFKELEKHKNLWGFKIEEPLITVKEISIDKNDIQIMGSNKTTLKFTYNNMEFIKFKSTEEEYEEMVSKGQTLIIDVVGRLGFNEYQGKKTPQVIMNDLEVIRVNKKQWVF